MAFGEAADLHKCSWRPTVAPETFGTHALELVTVFRNKVGFQLISGKGRTSEHYMICSRPLVC